MEINEDTINKYVVIIAVLCSFAVAFTSNAVSVALPTIAHDLNITNIMQNWVVNIYLLIIAAASVPFGKLCGKYGLNKTLKIGIIIYIIGAVLSGLAHNITFLMISRVIHAVGSAILFVNVMAIITSQIPPQRRGQAIGLNVTGVYMGLTLAPTIGGILSENIGWGSIFYVTIPLIIIAYCLLHLISKEWLIGDDVSIDIVGSLLYVIGIVVLVYGFTRFNQSIGMIMAVIGVIILIFFAKYELKITNPIYNINLFRNSKYTSSNIASLISYFATFVVTYILNYHFQYLEGLDAQTTGLILIVTPLLMAICSPFAGKLSDKIEPQILAAIGMGLVSIALFILCFMNQTTPLYMIIISMALQGIGFGIFSSPNNNVIMGSVSKKDIATASASLSTVRTIGQSFSLGLLTLIFAFIMGNVTINPSNYNLLIQSSQITMIIATISCIIAMILSLIGIKSKDKIIQ
ncbi:MFS transporter [Methanosphaera sp. WGK6]|uniref:MFS transporter n=1 Tax=Methanosphaera sp. WGK6 TaxID=1561964 RepID=UPI00084C8FAA|nr:MFS transporter [Methanosphaera sp. WGK6]OED29813.1 major facilitator transporter [Methanosphaera sp. WGK6]